MLENAINAEKTSLCTLRQRPRQILSIFFDGGGKSSKGFIASTRTLKFSFFTSNQPKKLFSGSFAVHFYPTPKIVVDVFSGPLMQHLKQFKDEYRMLISNKCVPKTLYKNISYLTLLSLQFTELRHFSDLNKIIPESAVTGKRGRETRKQFILCVLLNWQHFSHAGLYAMMFIRVAYCVKALSYYVNREQINFDYISSFPYIQ